MWRPTPENCKSAWKRNKIKWEYLCQINFMWFTKCLFKKEWCSIAQITQIICPFSTFDDFFFGFATHWILNLKAKICDSNIDKLDVFFSHFILLANCFVRRFGHNQCTIHYSSYYQPKRMYLWKGEICAKLK